MLATVLALAVAASDGAIAADGESLDWRLMSRFEPERTDVHRVVVELPEAACSVQKRRTWTVDGKPHRVRIPQNEIGPGCRAIVDLRDEGEHTIDARRLGSAKVNIKDRVVMAFGDALGSRGHGCGSGRPSSYELAVGLLAAGMKRTSLTYAGRGCDKERTAPRVAQVKQLKELHQEHRVDAVLLRFGGRHMRVGEVLRRCAERALCPDAPFRRGGERTVHQFVRSRLKKLPQELNAVAKDLDAAGVEAANVLAVPFVDAWRNPERERCDKRLEHLSPAEMRWIGGTLIGSTNIELAAAAARHGWKYAGEVPDALAQHGPCAARGDRWIRVTDGVPLPDNAGRLAIAGRLAPSLASVLELNRLGGQDEPGWPQEALDWVEAQAGQKWRWFVRQSFPAQAAMVVLLVGLVAFLAWKLGVGIAKRMAYIVMPSGRTRIGRRRVGPTRPTMSIPGTWLELAVRALGGLAAVIASAAFVTVVGAAILWMRFRAARIPADQSVAVVPQTELLVIGAQALIVFAILAVAAVIFVWLVDGKGRAIRATRRGLGVLVVLELIIVIVIEDFPLRQAVHLVAGLALVALLLHFLLDRALMPTSIFRSRTPLVTELRARWKWFFRTAPDPEPTLHPAVQPIAAVVAAEIVLAGAYLGWTLDGSDRLWGVGAVLAGALALWSFSAPDPAKQLRWIVRVLPLAVLAAALYWATRAESYDRLLLVPLLVLAAILFVVPWGIAARVETPRAPVLELPRLALAVTTIACVVTLVARDERWLAFTGVVALGLATLCLVVAHSSGDRFLPYGAAVLVSVPLFGAAVAILQVWESPEMQPMATISKDFERHTCGLFVAETDDRVYLARVDLDELGGIRRPRPRRSRLVWVRRDELAATSIGPLQPIGRAVDQALALRRGLLRNAGVKDPDRKAGVSCEATDTAPPTRRSRHRRLARQFQPHLILDREDGFWPVPVRTVFAMQDRHQRVCRRIDHRDPDVCIRVNTQADLPWIGGESESLELPATNDVASQRRILIDALGSVDPQRSAMEYFLRSGGGSRRAATRRRRKPISLQYWFFYTYNRQKLPAGTGGRHQGDFESVGVLLSSRSHRPRYVWMARHDDEGRVFTWNEPSLDHVGDHVRVYSAFGSHASYESCARQHRQQAPLGIIDDRPTCEDLRQVELQPESTPLTDLAHVPWACWQGQFGHRPGERVYESIPYVEGHGPRSPLWQQEFDDVTSRPCDGLRPPKTREGPGEEILGNDLARRIRIGAGQLTPLVDECSDWSKAPAIGTYLVACDSRSLRVYVNSGLENPGSKGVHIDDGDASAPQMGAVDIPAVRRAQTGRDFDTWRIASVRRTKVDVYASCRSEGALLAAQFRGVLLRPGRPLRLDDEHATHWRLRTPAGKTVLHGVEKPSVVHGKLEGRPRRCIGE